MSRVLLVDDNESNLQLLRTLLQGHGWTVDDARNGAEALHKAHQTPPGLVISDLLMPVMDGYTLLRHWKADGQLKDIPFVVYTATYTSPKDEQLALDLGADAFIVKPLEHEDLLNRLNALPLNRPGSQTAKIRLPLSDEQTLTREYNETLVRKLEDKCIQLELTNRRLAASETRLRAIIDTEPECVKLLDAAGTILEMNPAGLRMLDAVSLEDFVKHSVYPIIDAEYHGAMRGLIHRVFRGESGSLEFQITSLKGNRRWLHTIASPLRDESGAIIALLGITRDVTAIKQTEDALRESQARLELAIRATQLGPWDWDLATNQVYFSPEWKRQLGYNEHEIAGTYQEWESRLHPADKEHALTMIREYLSGARPGYEVEFRLRHKDGSFRWIYTRGEAVRDAAGNPVRLLGCHLDITKRKEAEESLRVLSAAVEQSPVAVVITGQDASIEYVNPQFTRITGYDFAEVRGLNPRILSSGATPKEVYEDLWRTIGTGARWHGEFCNKKKDGTLYWVRSAISAVRDATGSIAHYMALVEDITAQKALEAQFRQAQKLEAVGRLAGGIAHDFNNMLAVILGYTESALMTLEPVHPAYNDLEQVRTAASHSVELTRQLLAFSRQQIVAPRAVDLNTQTSAMEGLLHRVIGEDIAIQFVQAPGLWTIKIDPTQVDQILANLAINARDAMPNGGRLTIETANAVLREADGHELVDFHPGEFVVLAVSDTGSGMDENTLSHIFEPFFTTKVLGKGTGLGLATVYGAVRQNHGFIRATSAPGQGTKFTIYFPRELGEMDFVNSLERNTAAPGGHETVLLVEDDLMLRTFVSRLLTDLGYTVLEASDATEAITFCEQHSGEIHLLLTDVIMPGMNGRDLQRRLLLINPEIKVLFMSGYTGDIVASSGILEAGMHFIAKPFRKNELAGKVRLVLDSNI